MSSLIRLNSAGFLPRSPKRATVAKACTQFSVRTANDDRVVFSGSAETVYNDDTAEQLWVVDFSPLTETGTFYIEVPEAGRSVDFRIAVDLYTEPFRTVMLGMYLWRCGCSVSAVHNGVEYSHGECHTDDGCTDFFNGEDAKKEGTGGWHDAGDYNKYVVNSGVTVGLMLKAWEHFGTAISGVDLQSVPKGDIPQYLLEIKWNLDWVFKMQFPDGRVSHKMSARKFCGGIMPEEEKEKRYFVPWSTSATASFVAMMAQAARIYEPFDTAYSQNCIRAAQLSYDLLGGEQKNVYADQSGFQTGSYKTEDCDIRLWAAAEMWETTGEKEYLDDFQRRASGSSVKEQLTWYDVTNLGMLTYLLSARDGKDNCLVSNVRKSLVEIADKLVENSRSHGYGRTLGDFYNWGSTGTVAGTVHTLYAAFRITGDEKYMHAGEEALGYLLGRNSYGRSFVTGVGYNPPQNPHCRRSISDRKAWPGYLVGGPCENAGDWKDDSSDFRTNEIAINWNGAMVYALSAFLWEMVGKAES
ncbi:MAG: glycoside hydrolase family 9 protein [Chitinispirillaceae bacterium]